MPSKILTQNDFYGLREMPLGAPTEFETEAGEVITLTILQDEYQDSTRWYEIHTIVWHEHQGNTYAYDYEVPATEYQETYQEFTPRDIYEVIGKSVTVIKYVKKTA
jgi:hypothetical protein